MALLTVVAKDVRGVGCNKRGISGIILRPSKAHSHSVSAAPLTLKVQKSINYNHYVKIVVKVEVPICYMG